MRYLILLLIFVSGIESYSQEKIILHTKKAGNENLLRWIVTEPGLLMKTWQQGFVLKRTALKNISDSSLVNWDQAKIIYQFKLNKAEEEWKKAILKNEKLFLLYSFYRQPATENLFGLVLMEADLNRNFAAEAGLFHKDSLIHKDSVYFYRIEINGSEFHSTSVAKEKINKAIPAPGLKTKRKEVILRWNSEELKKYYSSYWIERSDTEHDFQKINSSPVVPMNSQYEEDKSEIYFQDTTVEYNKKYSYRLTGQNYYGELSEPSLLAEIKVHVQFEGEIFIDTIYSNDDSTGLIEWSVSKTLSKENIKELLIQRSVKYDEEYLTLAENESAGNEVKFKIPGNRNYIRLAAVSADQDTIYSWPELFLVPDKIPPATPMGLSGVIDSSGIIKLKWNKNTDEDFKGYRVFRTNSLKEEYVEITRTLLASPEFRDSISLNTLTEEIYYSVNAVDLNFNNSDKSDPVKILKPDTIAPQVSPIIRIEAQERGNFIGWKKSGSRDLDKVELQRSEDQITWKCIAAFEKGDLSELLDSTITNSIDYYYRTISIDDAGNKTNSGPVYLFNNNFSRKENKTIQYSVDRKKKIINLSWTNPGIAVESYEIYRSKKGEQLRLINTLDGDSVNLEDSDLYIGNEYEYLVIAKSESGKQTIVGEKLLIVF